jgi:crotonobetainyl-CoA:carnitine CoA-transferase CaiB-like acyl-CoA transferase
VKPLEGITVLDLTRLLPGAVATSYMAAQGAEVIKIEQPGEGDYARRMNPVLFARTNAGKKSVLLDLKGDRGPEVLLKLASKADVLIEGFRPGVMARLGLDYDHVSTVNARLIYLSLSGYGQSGPYSRLAGHDINYIALGGLLGLNLPVIPGVQIADLVGGSMQTIIGVLMALVERNQTGRGRYVDVSMLDGVRSLMVIPLAGSRVETLTGRYACYNIYPCRDGRWIAVGALEPKFWATLCRRLGCEDLIPLQFDDERRTEVKARLAGIFETNDAQSWFESLRDSDCCVTPVRSVNEISREMMAAPPELAAPELGEHTTEILRRIGVTA